MKKLIYIISFLALSLAVFARQPVETRKNTVVEKPDLDLIKKETLDPKSSYYYPELMKRYERNETIMDVNDYRYLYLGMIFQEDYNPYRKSEYRDKI